MQFEGSLPSTQVPIMNKMKPPCILTTQIFRAHSHIILLFFKLVSSCHGFYTNSVCPSYVSNVCYIACLFHHLWFFSPEYHTIWCNKAFTFSSEWNSIYKSPLCL